MDCMPQSPATKRYLKRFAIAAAAYLLALFVATRTFRHDHPAGAAAYLLAVLPALPILGMIVVVGVYLAEEKDEFQRNLFIQSMIWSIGATLAVTTVWGFLENFTNATHLQPYLIFPMFAVFVGISTPLLKLRYR
jgi:hypothetical protein